MNLLEDEVGFKSAARGSKPVARSSWIPVFVHGLLWIGLGVLLEVAVPQFTRLFEDFGFGASAMTAWTLRAGTFVIQYDWLFLLVLILLAPVDRAILDHLRRGPGGQRGDRRWSVLMMALPLGLGLIMVVTLLIPLIQLNNQLLGNLSG